MKIKKINIALLFINLLFLKGFAFSQNHRKPNVVYILTDQWRSSALAYAGDPNVKTPNLDKFSKESVNFTNAVSVTPVCTPHRASLLTGRYPTTTGMFLNDLYLPSKELCMAEIFKSEGYNTAYLGKWHLDGHGRENNVAPERRQGFNYWKALECSHDYNHMPYYENDNPEKKYWEGYSPFALAADAKVYMANHAKDQRPFLLFISIATPHFPHQSAPEEYKALYPKEKLILNPNIPKEIEEKVREELQGYYGHCTATDAAIGQVLDKLKELKIDKKTIVVFSADHGEMMGGHGIKPYTKQLAWDESIKVPFLIKYPKIGKIKGKKVHAPINTPDILPSLLGLANIPIPKTIEGENLASLIRSPNENADRVALLMNVHPFTNEFKYPEYRAIRTKQYSFIKTLDGSSKIFDNNLDPFQMMNLYNKPGYENLQNDLEKKLEIALKKIDDDFQPKEYYLKKWNLVLDKTKNAIDYWSFDKGNGIMQTPKMK